jgi:hypothetical protein
MKIGDRDILVIVDEQAAIVRAIVARAAGG